MGQIKTIKGKVAHKHETETDWLLSSYVPDAGELVIYNKDDRHPFPRIKAGDGENTVRDLPFSETPLSMSALQPEDLAEHTHTIGIGLTTIADVAAIGKVMYQVNLAFADKLVDNKLQLVDAASKEVVAEFDATHFIEDSYLNDVEIRGNNLEFTWKMDDGTTKTDSVDLTHLVDKVIAAHNISSEAHIDIREAIPTKITELENDAGYLTEDTIPVKGIIYNEEKQSFAIMENDKGESPVANGEYSIAIGTDDLDALGKLKDMAGSTITAEMPEANGNLSEAKGISTKAESTSAVADGVSSTAGIKGYYWNTITINNDGTSTITLSNEQYSSSAVKSTDWAEGDYVSIVNDTKYAFVGQITSITSEDSGTTIVVNSTKMGENKYGTLELLLKQLKPDDRTIFAIHRTKNSSTSVWTNTPRTGTVELAWGARVYGLNNLSAGTFGDVFGGNNALVGDFGFVTGRDNLGGYGNVVGGGWNESTGVHSAVIGRELKNYDDYTLMSGYGNQVLKGNLNAVTGGQNIITNGSGNLIGGYDNDVVSGNQSLVGGKENVITKGTGNILGGYQNILEDSTYSVVGGNNHTVSGDQDAVFGSSNIISNRSHYNVVGGLGNKITSGARHNLETGNENEITGAKSHNNAVSGSKNSVSSSENIVGGNNNDINTTGNIVGGAINKINNGTHNIVGGKENTLFNSTYSVVGGNSHDVYGDQNAVFGSDNTIGTSSARVHYNIVGGKGNIVSASATLTSGEQNKTKHKDSSTIGYGLETSAASQTVLGQYNDISGTSQDVLVVGYGSSDSPKNVLTVPRSGVPTKDTDAITLKALNEKLSDIDVDVDVKALTFDYSANYNQLGCEKLVYGDGLYVGIGKNNVGMSQIIWSHDGVSWNDDYVDQTGAWNYYSWTGIAYGNGKFVAVGKGSGDYSKVAIIENIDNADTTVTEVSLENHYNFVANDIEFINGKFIIVGYGLNETGDYVMCQFLTSEDGMEWAEVGIRGDAAVTDCLRATSIAYNNGKYVALTTYKNPHDSYTQKWFSEGTDLNNLDIYYWGFSDTPEIVIPITDGFFACDSNYYDAWFSRDGQNWTYLGYAHPGGCIAAACGNGKIITLSTDGIVYIYNESVLHETYEHRVGVKLLAESESNNWSDIIFANNEFIAVSTDDHVLHSEDGVYWLVGKGKFVQEDKNITSDIIDVLSDTFTSKAQHAYFFSNGGDIEGEVRVSDYGIPLVINTKDRNESLIEFKSYNNIAGYIGVDTNQNEPIFRVGKDIWTDSKYPIFHTGNYSNKIKEITTELKIKDAGIPLVIECTDNDYSIVQYIGRSGIIGHVGAGPNGPVYKKGFSDKLYNILHEGSIAENATIKALEARIAELEAKLAAMTVEPWTFTTEDGNDVAKAVYTKALSKFTIDNSSEYYFEDGMTWEDWVNSKYNSAGFYIIMRGSSDNPIYWVAISDSYIENVSPADKIVAASYILNSQP